jgi:hypothetical protein
MFHVEIETDPGSGKWRPMDSAPDLDAARRVATAIAQAGADYYGHVEWRIVEGRYGPVVAAGCASRLGDPRPRDGELACGCCGGALRVTPVSGAVPLPPMRIRQLTPKRPPSGVVSPECPPGD